MDWTSRETEAIKYGIRMFGEYMESIGKSDIFSGLTANEGWTAFTVFTKNYHGFLANKKIIDDEIPF